MKKWLDDKDILMYLTYNEEKSVIAERFIKCLKSKIYENMTADASNSYLDFLDELIDDFDNICLHSIGKKPIDAKYPDLS